MKILNAMILISCLLFVSGIVLAQETSNGTQAVALDENVTAEDLGIAEPNLLPDSPFYFFKNWGREIQGAFTFNPIKKAELREKFANEKLIELKLMVEKKKNSPAVEKATENYRKEVEKIKKAAENIKETTEESPLVGTFLDKFIQQRVLHERILEKLATQVSTTTFAKIEEARQQHLERFGEVMNRLEANKEKLQQRLETNLEKVKGSEFKNFKNLEMLKALEEKVPEAAQEAIRQVQTNVLTRLKEKIETPTSPETLEQFKAYTEKVSGEKEKQLEIIDDLKERLQEKPIIQQKLIETQVKIIEKIRTRAQEAR